jgi:hypothetical protein
MIGFKDNLGYKICCARLEIKDNLESLIEGYKEVLEIIEEAEKRWK